MNVKEKVREFLKKYIRNNEFEDTDDIFKLGFVNSLFAMQLVLFIEKEFGVRVENEDVQISNFSTVNGIVDLINRLSSQN